MSTVPEKKHWTVEEYLAFDRESEERWDYYRGEVFNMSGASLPHNQIAGNAFASLHTQLRDRDCLVLITDQRVMGNHHDDFYTYPDVVATCASPEFVEGKFNTLKNPQLVIEVLSDSTEKYDRVTKFEELRTLPSLREYVLIAQDRIHVDQFRLNSEGEWALVDASEPEATINLASIGCELKLADVYAKVKFDTK